MSKKLLEESTIRQFMKLASLEPLSSNFLEEKRGDARRPMREEEMEEGIRDEDGTTPLPPVKGLGKKETLKSTEKADKEARAKLEKKPGKVEEEITLEEELDALLEDELSEMDDSVLRGQSQESKPLEEMGAPMYEEDEDMEVEAESGDMEAEINITPDQARAIIAVADMLKDIMPDLDAPEGEEEMDMEDDAEAEMDMDMDMDADAEAEEADADLDAAAGEEEEAEEEEEEELAEQIMKRVKARLSEMKNK